MIYDADIEAQRRFGALRMVTGREGPAPREGWRLAVLSVPTDPPFRHFESSTLSAPARCISRGSLAHIAVNYRRFQHEAPDPACECGYRVSPSLDLIRLLFERVAEQAPPIRRGAWAFYRVRIHGRAVPSDLTKGDYYGTWRVAQIEIASPVIFPRNADGTAGADRLRAHSPSTPAIFVAPDEILNMTTKRAEQILATTPRRDYE